MPEVGTAVGWVLMLLGGHVTFVNYYCSAKATREEAYSQIPLVGGVFLAGGCYLVFSIPLALAALIALVDLGCAMFAVLAWQFVISSLRKRPWPTRLGIASLLSLAGLSYQMVGQYQFRGLVHEIAFSYKQRLNALGPSGSLTLADHMTSLDGQHQLGVKVHEFRCEPGRIQFTLSRLLWPFEGTVTKELTWQHNQWWVSK